MYLPVLGFPHKHMLKSLHLPVVISRLACLITCPCRWDFFLEACTLNRAFFAFILDLVLYSVFQTVLLANAPPAYRYTPFFGLAAWLIAPSEVEPED